MPTPSSCHRAACSTVSSDRCRAWRLKDDGRIYVNGKYVESLLLNGEDFFSKDHKIMLDNLPAYMVKNVKVYDKASVLGEHLHKKLGDETYVMDVSLKKEYNTGWIANVEGWWRHP